MMVTVFLFLVSDSCGQVVRVRCTGLAESRGAGEISQEL